MHAAATILIQFVQSDPWNKYRFDSLLISHLFLFPLLFLPSPSLCHHPLSFPLLPYVLPSSHSLLHRSVPLLHAPSLVHLHHSAPLSSTFLPSDPLFSPLSPLSAPSYLLIPSYPFSPPPSAPSSPPHSHLFLYPSCYSLSLSLIPSPSISSPLIHFPSLCSHLLSPPFICFHYTPLSSYLLLTNSFPSPHRPSHPFPFYSYSFPLTPVPLAAPLSLIHFNIILAIFLE